MKGYTVLLEFEKAIQKQLSFVFKKWNKTCTEQDVDGYGEAPLPLSVGNDGITFTVFV